MLNPALLKRKRDVNRLGRLKENATCVESFDRIHQGMFARGCSDCLPLSKGSHPSSQRKESGMRPRASTFVLSPSPKVSQMEGDLLRTVSFCLTKAASWAEKMKLK